MQKAGTVTTTTLWLLCVTSIIRADKTVGEGRGLAVPEFVCAQCERKHERRGCISFPLWSNSKFLSSCHSLCLYSWIQSECFRDFLSTIMKVCPVCLSGSKLLLSNQTQVDVIFHIYSLFKWSLYIHRELYTALKFSNDSFNQWILKNYFEYSKCHFEKI